VTDRIVVVVADAGPLIHLDELDCLALLADFSVVWVPQAVWSEVESHRPSALARKDVQIVRCSATPNPRIHALAMIHTLHAGEREALEVCSEHPGAVLLTDDTAARLAAKTLGIRAHGTLGILLRAIRRSQKTSAEVVSLLGEIPDKSTLHVRPNLLDDIIRLAGDAKPEQES
jgi:predicted nucleic acid-binding protein